ncbi:ABC transporter ATP-binding protein [Thermodesulfobacteriota bacterium]
MDPLIRLENVRKSYPSGGTRKIEPLKRVDLHIQRGERIILLGKSGSGKSTLLNLIGGVDLPTSGRVYFDGREISALSPHELAQYRRAKVGFIFQSFNLFSTLTVGENVTLPMDLLGVPGNRKAEEVLAAVGLDGMWDRFPEQLSGGEQQRVAIARALVKDPPIILADEPTGNLDLDTGNGILKLIDEACRSRGATLIMATHNRDDLWIADRRFGLRSGLLEQELEPPRRGTAGIQ